MVRAAGGRRPSLELMMRESKADCAFNNDGETTSKVESAVEINDDGE